MICLETAGEKKKREENGPNAEAADPGPQLDSHISRGPVSMQPSVLPECQLISAMTHSPAPPLRGPSNPLHSLKSDPS